MTAPIADNLSRIRERIAIACAHSGRDPQSVKLMAVTKTVSAERILQAVEAGITILGENYVQEAREKITYLTERPAMKKSDSAGAFQQPQWHMIGHLQTNKAKYAVKLFDYIHSVDRFDLAVELDRRAKALSRKINILIEVNVSGEQTKNGVPAKEAPELMEKIAPLANLDVKGLMTMAPYSDNPELSRPFFKSLRNLRNDIARRNIPGICLEELSMGMTDDFAVAVEEGATIVRIGRAIFGERG